MAESVRPLGDGGGEEVVPGGVGGAGASGRGVWTMSCSSAKARSPHAVELPRLGASGCWMWRRSSHRHLWCRAGGVRRMRPKGGAG